MEAFHCITQTSTYRVLKTTIIPGEPPREYNLRLYSKSKMATLWCGVSLMNTLTFNTCQFLHWNYVPWTQYLGPLLSIFVLLFKLYLYLSACGRVLLTLASCIGDPCLLTILAYIKNYNPKLLVIIILGLHILENGYNCFQHDPDVIVR